MPQNEQILIDEITRRAEQDLVSPEEAIARFGVKSGTEQDQVGRVKVWFEFKSERGGYAIRPAQQNKSRADWPCSLSPASLCRCAN